jgi:hypothetical protein
MCRRIEEPLCVLAGSVLYIIYPYRRYSVVIKAVKKFLCSILLVLPCNPLILLTSQLDYSQFVPNFVNFIRLINADSHGLQVKFRAISLARVNVLHSGVYRHRVDLSNAAIFSG